MNEADLAKIPEHGPNTMDIVIRLARLEGAMAIYPLIPAVWNPLFDFRTVSASIVRIMLDAVAADGCSCKVCKASRDFAELLQENMGGTMFDHPGDSIGTPQGSA